MKKYLGLLNDVSDIQFNQDKLIDQCRSRLDVEYNIYQSFNFIDGTGYMKTVKDEIDFVLSGYENRGINNLTSSAFIKEWGFEEFIDHDLSHLSGGWKKYLGLALFTNQKSRGKIYFDSCRQLSDLLIRRFIHNLQQTNLEIAFFFEYDTLLLDGYNFEKVLFSNNTEKDNSKLINEGLLLNETNY